MQNSLWKTGLIIGLLALFIRGITASSNGNIILVNYVKSER